MVAVLPLGTAACGGGGSAPPAAAPPTAPTPYRYQVPSALPDGWTVASLSDAQIETAPIEGLVQRIREKQAGLRHLDGLLIARHGKLVLEENFRSALDFTDAWARNQDLGLHALNSVTKSFAATLVGQAIDDRWLDSTELRVHDAFADLQPIGAWSPAKASTRLADWLTMRHGLQWDELSSSYFESSNINTRMNAAANPLRFLLGLPQAAEPGQVFAYSTGISYALGVLVQRATGLAVETYLQRRLLQPLNIGKHTGWSLAGHFHMGSALYLSLRDMSKLGQLYLDGGTWNGQRLVSADWVRQATQQRLQGPGYGYGYQWWMTDFQVQGRTLTSFYAHGFGGQFIFVLPQLNTVVGLLGSAYNAGDDALRDARRLLEGDLLPALR